MSDAPCSPSKQPLGQNHLSEFDALLTLLAAIAVLAAIGRRISVPDPIVFAIGGLALALTPGIPRLALPPSLILVVFLPPLIFAAAQDTSWTELRKEAYPILLLAVGLVLVTMSAVAIVAHALVPALPWAAAFTLGAIVSPPDAVAAKAISETLRLPRRLVSILDGEGLVNDAVALVAFQVASGLVVTGAVFSLPSATLRIVYSAATAIGIGVGVGWIGRHAMSTVEDPVIQNTVTLLLPFGAFLPAEYIHASGVLAVLSLALYLSRFGVTESFSVSRLEGRVLWDMIAFLLTGLSFVLVGLQLPTVLQDLASDSRIVPTTIAVCLTVVLIRPAWVFGMAWLSHGVRSALGESTVGHRPSKRVLGVLGWAGMRGVVSLALALSLPLATADGRPFPGRSLIVFVTFVVVLVTLVGQGLTLPWVIDRLRVRDAVEPIDHQEYGAQLRMAEVASGRIGEIADEARSPPAAVERVRDFYADRIRRLGKRQRMGLANHAERTEDAAMRAAAHDLLEKLLQVEHSELQELRGRGAVDEPMARHIQSRLDALRQLDGR